MRPKDSAFQMLRKLNRIEDLELQGATLKKKTVKCKNCQEIGHYKSTCINACHNCSFRPYSGHMVEMETGYKIASCLISDSSSSEDDSE